MFRCIHRPVADSANEQQMDNSLTEIHRGMCVYVCMCVCVCVMLTWLLSETVCACVVGRCFSCTRWFAM